MEKEMEICPSYILWYNRFISLIYRQLTYFIHTQSPTSSDKGIYTSKEINILLMEEGKLMTSISQM